MEAIERRIVARRRSLSDMADVGVDDAMRSTSLHMVAGAGLALLLQFVGPLISLCLAAAIPGEAGGIVAGVLVAIALIASIVCWIEIAHPSTYRIRRDVRTAP